MKNKEIFTVFALFIVPVTAAATAMMGLSLTLGTFLGGMMTFETSYRHVIQTELKAFRGLLLSFFFTTVGMSLNTEVLFRHWAQVLYCIDG